MTGSAKPPHRTSGESRDITDPGVTGGTGTLGRHVVPLLRNAGAHVRVLGRGAHRPATGLEYVTGDLLTEEGLERAVAGAGTVLHLAGGPKGDDEATRRLVAAASRAEVRHLVYLSVVGADAVPVGWLRSKRRGAGGRRLEHPVDHPACGPVPRAGPDRAAEDGQAAGDPGPARADAGQGRTCLPCR